MQSLGAARIFFTVRSLSIVILAALAACGDGDSQMTSPTAACDAPGVHSAPLLAGTVSTELVAVSGSGKNLLSWNAPPGAAGFDIYRGTRAGAEESTPLATNISSLTYLDSAVVAATRYFYRVAATQPGNGCSTSPLSNEASAQPTAADAAAAFAAIVHRDNPFAARAYLPAPLPTFDPNRLPQPIVDDHPEWVALYAKAWELAFDHLRQPTPANGFISNYIDPAFFNRHIFQWDTIFMLQFGKYAHPYLETIGSLDNFYAKQHPDGFISREINEANGQDIYYKSIADAANPPLFSWAEWRHYQFTGDSSRFADVLVPIAKHYDWLQRNRIRASGTYWNTGLGAGEDDLQRGDAYAWLDMTAQQAQNALFCGAIATAAGDDALAAFFLDEYLSLGALLRDKFWDAAAAIFTDLDSEDKPTGIKTVLAFWPLLAHVGSPAHARALAEHLQNPAEFWRPDVIPALAADESGYTPSGQYWNGAVWAPTNYMAISGLRDYGFHDLAGAAAQIYLTNLAAVFDATGTIWEHYAPESATGEGFRDFVGWSGLGPIAMLIENVLGVRVDAASNTVTWRPMLPGRNGIQNLSFGGTMVTLIASPIRDSQRTLSITTSTPLRIAVDTGAYQGTYVVSSRTLDVTVPAGHW